MARRIVWTNDGGLEIKESKKRLVPPKSTVDEYPMLESNRQKKAREWKREAALHAVEKTEKTSDGFMGIVEDPVDLVDLLDAVGLKIHKPKFPKR